MKRFFILLALSLLIASPAQAKVPDDVQQALMHGLNLETWMEGARPGGYALNDDAIQQIVDCGFTHVRLPLNPALLLSNKARTLERLDDALARLIKANLVVIVDFHPQDMPKAWESPLRQPAMAAQLWQDLATHLAPTDPRQVVIELYNEPPMSNQIWEPYMRSLFAVVRNILPNHTIIVGPGDSNNLSSLLTFHPLEDDNVVYSFHFYSPMRFTHQGATWMSNDSFRYAKNVPFPAHLTPEMSSFLDELRTKGDKDNADELAAYLNSSYGEADLHQAISKAGEWSRHYQRPVILDEFGVMRDASAPKDRLLWVSTVRKAAEDNEMGWTFWEHGSTFGLFHGVGFEWVLDEKMWEALGLRQTP